MADGSPRASWRDTWPLEFPTGPCLWCLRPFDDHPPGVVAPMTIGVPGRLRNRLEMQDLRLVPGWCNVDCQHAHELDWGADDSAVTRWNRFDVEGDRLHVWLNAAIADAQ